MTQNKAFHSFITLLLVVAGNFIYAAAVKLFLLPAGLLTGGTTGISLAVKHFTGFDISAFILVFNVLMLILGWLLIGRAFAMTTVVSTFVYPLALKLFDNLFGSLVLTDDIFLCTMFSGLGIGLALGIVIRAGASTGGMDIPPLILNRYFRIPVSGSMYVFDFAILLLQAAYSSPEKILYGLLLVLVYTVTLDKLLLVGTEKIEVKVISRQSEEIRKAILTEVDRGVTILEGKGGFLGKPEEILMSVISNRQLTSVERLIHAIDPEAFLVVSRVSEVRGRGFSLRKRYMKK